MIPSKSSILLAEKTTIKLDQELQIPSLRDLISLLTQ